MKKWDILISYRLLYNGVKIHNKSMILCIFVLKSGQRVRFSSITMLGRISLRWVDMYKKNISDRRVWCLAKRCWAESHFESCLWWRLERSSAHWTTNSGACCRARWCWWSGWRSGSFFPRCPEGQDQPSASTHPGGKYSRLARCSMGKSAIHRFFLCFDI